MKIIKFFTLILAVTLMVSCEKHEIEFGGEYVSDMAEFQLHYIAPVTAVAANNLTRVDINNQMFANNKAPLNTYNAIPSGGVGRFYDVQPGNVNIKLYKLGKITVDSLVYEQNVTLAKGKQNLFIHDMTKPPVVIDNGYPYERRETVQDDSTIWVKFYNFLYETAGVPTTLKLQYQYVSHRTNELVNIGEPVAFAETTGWQQVLFIKEGPLDNDRRIDYRIKVIDDNGSVVGDLQIRNSSGTYVSYADWWTGILGRRYHHIFAGMRAAAPASAVRVFTAL